MSAHEQSPEQPDGILRALSEALTPDVVATSALTGRTFAVGFPRTPGRWVHSQITVTQYPVTEAIQGESWISHRIALRSADEENAGDWLYKIEDGKLVYDGGDEDILDEEEIAYLAEAVGDTDFSAIDGEFFGVEDDIQVQAFGIRGQE